MLKVINTISDLENWYNKYFFENKILLVNSFREGKQINNLLAYNHKNVLNLEYKLISDIAKDNINYKKIENKLILNNKDCVNIMKEVLINLQKTRKLGYFQHIQITSTVAKLFYNTYLELELEDISQFPQNLINTNEKLKSLEKIFTKFKENIENSKFLSKVEILKLFLNSHEIINDNTIHYAIVNKSHVNKMNLNILKKLTGYEPSICDNKEYTITSLKNKNIEFYSAHGEINEIYEILRQIKIKNLKLEDIVIYHTGNQIYSQIMYELSQLFNVPITFSEGVSINNTIEAKFIYQIINWINSNYEVNEFCNLIDYIDLSKFNDKYVDNFEYRLSKSYIKKTLRNLNITLGQNRYLQKIEQEKEELNKKIENKDNKDNSLNVKYIEKLEKLSVLEIFIQTLFEYIPELQTTYNEVVNCIKKIIKEFSKKTSNKMNPKKVIDSVFENFESIYENENLNIILEEIKSDLSERNTMKEYEKGGCIHFTDYKNGFWTNRKYHFFVGMDSTKFPGDIKENPLLLDYEKKSLNNLGYNLELAQSKPNDDISYMYKLLNTRKGDVIISYSAFNTLKNRKVNPSYMFLEIVRENNPEINIGYNNFENIIGLPKGLVSEKFDGCLTEEEEWLYYSFKSNKKINILNAVNEYEICKELYSVNQIKNKESISEYEGYINNHNLAPINDLKNSISVTSLERYADCPYKYFLRNILNIKPIDNKELDFDEWLNKLEFGNIMHKVFENYYKKLISTNDSIDINEYFNIIANICEDTVSQFKENKKYPVNIHAYVRQVDEIKNLCEAFVKNEIDINAPIPYDVEYSFGNISSKINNAVIDIEDDIKIYIKGKIDRIDKISDFEYEIKDYKTGKSKKYSNDDFNLGKNLQIMVYALCLENLIQNISIKNSKYYFTSIKEDFKEINMTINDENIHKCKKIISEILKLMNNGIFIKNCSKKSNCSYCDYASICKFDRDVDKIYSKFYSMGYINEDREVLAFYGE